MKVSLRHGGGGEETAWLIQSIFMKHFSNDLGGAAHDAAVLPLTGQAVFTTDSFVVTPLFFPGGDIGRLAVCGTVNDLLTAGAVPKYLSAGFIIHEGVESETLEAVAESMAKACREAKVNIVTGDTKVVEGPGGLYINTAGIGELSGQPVRFEDAREGDAVIVSGTLGDHHACIMSARMGITNGIRSDAAPLVDMISRLRNAGVALHGLRDITRGGLATVLNEAAGLCGLRVELWEEALPVDPQVRGLCGILGLDALYMGNEGNMCLITPEPERALDIMKGSAYGARAAIVGQLLPGSGVTLRTRIGGARLLAPLRGEGLPRIC